MALEEKLAAANQESVKHAKSIIIFVGLVGLGVVLFTLSPSWFKRNTQSTNATDSVRANLNTQSTSKGLGSPKTIVDQADEFSRQPENQNKIIPQSPESGCTTSDQSDEYCQKLRALFKEELKIFETNFEPTLKVGSVNQWAFDIHSKIFEQKRMALEAFSVGDYSKALTQIRGATIESTNILKIRDAKFETHLNAAVSGLESNQYESAIAEIDNALFLFPNHPIAQGYRARITLMPKVLNYLQKSYKARAENDFRSERDHLEKLIRLDPARKTEKLRLDLLKKKIAEEDFAILISKGLKAVDQRDIDAAKINLEKAQGVFSQRAELSLLKKNIERLDREMSLARAMSDANMAILKDDWGNAYQAFSKAKSIDPNNSEAIKGERIASELQARRQALDSYLDEPSRLSSKAVLAAAQQLLETIRHLTSLSPSLKARAEQLSRFISKATTSVRVVVKSDGNTEISVRRVGIVGKILQKAINLRPGNYTFEGKRAGYKSKLVNLRVPFDGAGIEIRIVCDEKI